MRLSFCRAALAASFVLSALAAPVLGQAIPAAGPPRPGVPAAGPAALPAAPAGASAGTTVVVLDIAEIFKTYHRFNGLMNDIKKDIEAFEAFVKGEQVKFNNKKEELLTFKPGTLEYKQKEEELARMQSDLQVQVGLKRKEFLEQEARVYFHIYREIEQVVGQFAVRNRIDLVLRFNGDPMKEDDRASVLQGVNRAIVYQNGRDITAHILAELNRLYPPAPGAAAPAPSGAGQPAGTISRPPIVPGRPAPAGIPR